jgi:uncharacterized membrane protein YeaQ/YmgE (transglycosylase-associated protein family)
MDWTALLIQLVSGAAGGNAGSLISKTKSLGPLMNTILGAIGGIGGGQLLGGPLSGLFGGPTGGNIGASAVVGLLLPLIAGFLKKNT